MQGPAALYLRPQVCAQEVTLALLVNMHVESERHLVASNVLHAWRHVVPNRKQSLAAWHCDVD